MLGRRAVRSSSGNVSALTRLPDRLAIERQGARNLLHALPGSIELAYCLVAIQAYLPFVVFGSLPIRPQIAHSQRCTGGRSADESHLFERLAMMGQDALTHIGDVPEEMVPIRHLDRLWGPLPCPTSILSCAIAAHDLYTWMAP
jgi:hypothetical protein